MLAQNGNALLLKKGAGYGGGQSQADQAQTSGPDAEVQGGKDETVEPQSACFSQAIRRRCRIKQGKLS